jgi:peptidoglycan/xylan/chitin deacetylase (PgdA/CDA1 family)
LLHFYKTPDLLKKISKDLIWNVSTNNKEIYITFDDGPIPNLTEYALNVLDEYEAKATFFCVGDNIKKHPHICEKVIKKGHAIGNHTYNHLKGWSTKNSLYLKNIDLCQEYISEFQEAGTTPLFRPPYGQISRNQIKILRKDYRIIMWDILAYDFAGSHTPSQSLDRILKLTKPGSIVVFHDNYKAEKKLKYMLPRFLKHFKENGFTFKELHSF